MTAAEQLLEQGRSEGRVEERVERQVERQSRLILKQLRFRFGVVSETVAVRVQNASAAELEAMAERALTAKRTGDVISAES